MYKNFQLWKKNTKDTGNTKIAWDSSLIQSLHSITLAKPSWEKYRIHNLDEAEPIDVKICSILLVWKERVWIWTTILLSAIFYLQIPSGYDCFTFHWISFPSKIYMNIYFSFTSDIIRKVSSYQIRFDWFIVDIQ